MNPVEAHLLLAAAGLAAVVLALGYRVSQGQPGVQSGFAPETLEGGPLAAALLTRTGYASALALIAVVAAAIIVARHASLVPVAIVVVLQLLSQGAVMLLKAHFRRARPNQWLFRRESGFSYPSGHATTAVVFYGGWLLIVVSSALSANLKWPSIAALLLWMLGICWSRLALRAHYLTDVLGGALFGASFLCAGMAVALAA